MKGLVCPLMRGRPLDRCCRKPRLGHSGPSGVDQGEPLMMTMRLLLLLRPASSRSFPPLMGQLPGSDPGERRRNWDRKEPGYMYPLPTELVVDEKLEAGGLRLQESQASCHEHVDWAHNRKSKALGCYCLCCVGFA